MQVERLYLCSWWMIWWLCYLNIVCYLFLFSRAFAVIVVKFIEKANKQCRNDRRFSEFLNWIYISTCTQKRSECHTYQTWRRSFALNTNRKLVANRWFAFHEHIENSLVYFINSKNSVKLNENARPTCIFPTYQSQKRKFAKCTRKCQTKKHFNFLLSLELAHVWRFVLTELPRTLYIPTNRSNFNNIGCQFKLKWTVEIDAKSMSTICNKLFAWIVHARSNSFNIMRWIYFH